MSEQFLNTSKPSSTTPIPNPSDVDRGPPVRNLELSIEPGSVYLVLFNMGSIKNFHWSLVVATTERTGMMYHNTNTSGAFKFDPYLHPHLLNSVTFLLALKFAEITSYDREFHQYFANTLSKISTENRTCRPWVLEAIYETADLGLIKFAPSRSEISLLATEAVLLVDADESKTPKVLVSKYFAK
ncbi:hypothetical protein LOZ53_004721 [Ophidiomyces ophidiicola]|nr:hypothetical protein LOZ53_004721 [Ophidiomyces ophidiicola]